MDRAHPTADVSARDWTRTRTSDATTPPPPAATAVVEAVREDHPAPVAVAGAAPRLPLLVQGLLPALAAAALALSASGGRLTLAAAVLALQLAVAAALLVLLDAPSARGCFVVAAGAALAADAVVLADGDVDRLAPVVGLALVVALLHQLVRRTRSRVTESLADTLLCVVVGVGGACLMALPADDAGEEVLLLALAAVAAVLLAARIGDRLLPRPGLAVGATRGWPGLVLGLLCGVGAALALTAGAPLDLTAPTAALVALVVGATVAAADLAVDLGGAELRAGRRDARRVSALRPAAVLLPFAVLGPVVLLAGRLVLP